MRLIMNSGHSYEIFGRMITAGDEFEVPDKEGETWVRLGRARLKTKTPVDIEKRHYRRRDMRAEEE